MVARTQYRVVTPEDISLVGPHHICNNTPPQYTDDGKYIPPTHDRLDGWRIAYSDAYPAGIYTNDNSGQGAKAVHYFNNEVGQNPKISVVNDENKWQFRESGAITNIFGGPDAHLQRPWSEDLEYDQHGGYDTYYPEGMVDSVNGISLSEYVNGDTYVPCWGLTDVVDGTYGSLSDRDTPNSSKGTNTMEITNNKYTPNRGGPDGNMDSALTRARNSHWGPDKLPFPDQTLDGEKNRFTGIPHGLSTNDPYQRPSHGYNGISFGGFRHATPDIPKITSPFPNNWAKTQSQFNTTFTASDSYGVGSTAKSTGVRFEFTLPYNINRVLPPPGAGTWTNRSGRSGLGRTTNGEGGRYLKVSCHSPGANGDNWLVEDYTALGSTSSGGTPTNMTEKTQYIDFSNFDYDDCYSKVKVNFDGNLYATGNWTKGYGIFTRVKLFDAISGTWSNVVTTYYNNPAEARDRFVPIGHFVPYYVDKNDSDWLFWNPITYRGDDNSASVPVTQGQLANTSPDYNTNGPMERFMAGFWNIAKNSSGNYPYSNNLANSENIFRHFCITKAIIWYGCIGESASNSNSYVQLGNGSILDDKFTIACRFQFPSLVGKHVIAHGAHSTSHLSGPYANHVGVAATKQSDGNPQGALHPDFFENGNGNVQGFSDRHRRWLVSVNNNPFGYVKIGDSVNVKTSYKLAGLSHPTLATTRPEPYVENKANYSDGGHPDTTNLIENHTGYAYPCGYQDVIATKVGSGTKIRATWQQTGNSGHVGDYII